MIKCRVFGSPDLTDSTGHRLSATLGNPRRFALLAYLAVEARGRTVPRDRLVAMFWPNLDGHQARSAFRRTLVALRRDLGDGVIRDLGATLLIMNPDKFVCDVSAFENALRESRLERALAIYETGLLEGVTLADSREFNAWLARKRADYAEQASDAATHLRAAAISAPIVPAASISIPAAPAPAIPAPAILTPTFPTPTIPTPAIPTPAIPTRRISSEWFPARPARPARPAFVMRTQPRLAIARARALATASALVVVAAAWFTWEPLKHLGDFGGNLRLSGGSTRNVEAVALYQQGVAFANKRTPDGVARAVGHFQKAILLDSNYALAYAGLSKALQQAAAHGLLPQSDALHMSRAVVMHALRLDPSLADAHASLGYIKLHLERDWPGAEAALRRAIELRPGHATAYHYLAELGANYERSGRRADAARVRQTFRPNSGAR